MASRQGAAAAHPRADRLPLALGVAFFASGFAGLMHQVAWSKLLVHLIGATAYAQAVVLAVFMGGLAIGALLAGRIADRSGRSLELYIGLELGIALYCAALPWLVDAAAVLYVEPARALFESAGATLLLRFALALSLVLGPAVAMGATLPLLARDAISRVEDTQHHVGLLYAVNSAGAVLGAGTAGFVALPALGVQGALWIASALNAAAALAVLPRWRGSSRADAGSERATLPVHSAHEAKAPARAPGIRGAAPVVALALSGFAAMGYEVLFNRLIALSFGSSAYSFTLMLMAFITGIALGSAFVSRARVRDPLRWLGISQLIVVASLLAVTPLLSRLPYLAGLLRLALRDAPLGFELDQLGNALLCLGALLVPTACLGVGFPLVSRIEARHASEVGTRVGATYAWNTAGNVAGVLATSLLLLPTLGWLQAFHLLLALNAAAGFLALWAAEPAQNTGSRRLTTPAFALAFVVACYGAFGRGWLDPVRYSRNHLRLDANRLAELQAEGRSRFDAWRSLHTVDPESGYLLFFEEDAHATVMAYGAGLARSLAVNSKPDANTGLDMTTQLLLGHAPLMSNLAAKNVLVVGYGSGVTVGAVLAHPVARVDVVEISPAVLHADPQFAVHNRAALADSRVHTYVEDAQSFLRAVPRRYDVIVSEPSNPWIAGIGDLFTVEFFEAVRARLEPGGVFGFWYHTYDQNDETIALVFRTLASVFPHIEVFHDRWYVDMIAVASVDAISPDFAGMRTRLHAPAVRDDLARIDVVDVPSLLLHHGLSSHSANSFGAGALNHARHQRLEYMATRGLFAYRDSRYLDERDDLLRGSGKTDLWLDRYLAFRMQSGAPAAPSELDAAIRLAIAEGRHTEPLGAALTLRQNALTALTQGSAPPPISRPLPGELGLHESLYWARRSYEDAGGAQQSRDAARPFLARARELDAHSPFLAEIEATIARFEESAQGSRRTE